MKKMYITPAVEINETIAYNMIALSLQSSPADDSEVFGNEESDLDIWS